MTIDMRGSVLLAAICASLFGATLSLAVHAAEPREEAESLFRAADEQIKGGNYAAACPMLKRSDELDPAAGTKFNLADCYEHSGKTLEAHALFTRVVELAHETGRASLEEKASQRKAALEPRLVKLEFTVAEERPRQTLTIDQKPILVSELRKPVFLEPGRHTFVSSAAGYTDWKFERTYDAGTVGAVGVPPLDEAKPSEPARNEIPPASPVTAPSEAAPPAFHESTWHKPAAIGLFAGSGVSLAIGGAMGILAMKTLNDLEAKCQGGMTNPCLGADAKSDALSSRFKTQSAVSTVGFAAFGVLAAAAIVVLVLAPSKAQTGKYLFPNVIRF